MATSLKASVVPWKSQHEAVRPRLHQRHHRAVAEGGIGLVDHALERLIVDLAADEGLEHREGRFLVGEAAQRRISFLEKLGQLSGT